MGITSDQSISIFWYRRLCDGAAFLGAALLILFIFAQLSPDQTLSLFVPISAVIAATISGIGGLVGHLLHPKHQARASWIIFSFILGTILILITQSGGINSPFVALWLLVGLASGVLGISGIILTFLINSAYMGIAAWFGWLHGPTQQFILLLIASQVPLVVAYLLWHHRVFSGPGLPTTHDAAAISHLSEQLNRESLKSEIIINSIADGVMVINDQGHIQLLNPAAQTLTGWEENDAIDLDYRSVLQLLDGQDQLIERNEPVQKVLTTNESLHRDDISLRTRAEKKMLISLAISPIGTKERAYGAIAVFRDITKEKAEERQQAEFISTASHEMRTPVAAIEGYLSLALNPAVSAIDDKARDYLQKAHEATQHLGRLFQDLLTISKAEDGRLNNSPKVLDIVDFVRDQWEEQQQKALAKNLSYQFIPGPAQDGTLEGTKVIQPIFYTHVDPDRLREVIGNLIDNAIKYTTEGSVSIDITADEQNVTIGVTDTGIGIAKEDISHLFQKFYRVDSSYTREVGGTGLGLYISRKIIEDSGGQIWVQSELGKGSTFYVQLPRLSNEKAAFLEKQNAPTVPKA